MVKAEPIKARIYDQEGNLQPIVVTCPHFAEWLRVHDRYTVHKPEQQEPTNG